MGKTDWYTDWEARKDAYTDMLEEYRVRERPVDKEGA